jgi:hypothetical protein
MKNPILVLASLLTFIAPAAHARADEIRRVEQLPTNKVHCYLLFENRGVGATLELRNEPGVDYLLADLTLYRNGAEVDRRTNLEVIVSANRESIEAGNFGLSGLETAAHTLFSVRVNPLLGDGYSGAVIAPGTPSLSRYPKSNAACAFGK